MKRPVPVARRQGGAESMSRLVWRRFRRHRLALAGMAILLALSLFAFAVPLFVAEDAANRLVVTEILRPPSVARPFGTDDVGRDIFLRSVFGGQVSLRIGFLAALLSVTIGIAVGAPWRGRRVDTVGLRRALIPSVISEAVIWSVVPLVSYEVLLPLVFVGGLLTLPIFSVVRQSLGVLASGEQRRTAFTLDAISTELVFMIGPAAGALVATAGLSVLGLTVVGIATSVSGLLLMWFNPPTRSAVPVHGSDPVAGAAGPPAGHATDVRRWPVLHRKPQGAFRGGDTARPGQRKRR